MEIKFPKSIATFLTALFVDALLSFIIFATTAYFFWGAPAAKVAFFMGMLLMWNASVDSANEGKATETVKKSTGLDKIVSGRGDIVLKKNGEVDIR